MDYDGNFFMQQTVEWSLLNDGMAITVSAIALLYYRIIYKYLLTCKESLAEVQRAFEELQDKFGLKVSPGRRPPLL